MINSELVESLAKKHRSGPPARRWLGMSRDDVETVLRLLEQFRKDPTIIPFPSERSSYGRSGGIIPVLKLKLAVAAAAASRCSSAPMQKLKETASSASCIAVNGSGDCPLPSSSRQKNNNLGFKPSRLMPLHVPGPKALHQNVLIRAYDSEMDGRENEDKEGEIIWGTGDGKPQEDDQCQRLDSSEGAAAAEDSNKTEKLFYKSADDDDDEGLTIESFVPFFSVTR
jgi:hypothetical protein